MTSEEFIDLCRICDGRPFVLRQSMCVTLPFELNHNSRSHKTIVVSDIYLRALLHNIGNLEHERQKFLELSSAGLYGVEQKTILPSFTIRFPRVRRSRHSFSEILFLRIEENDLTAGRIETKWHINKFLKTFSHLLLLFRGNKKKHEAAPAGTKQLATDGAFRHC